MDYGEILSRAWQIISKHKVLWLFGVLASCASGQQSNSFNFDFPAPETPPVGEFPEFPTLPAESIPLFLGILCVMLILIVLFFVLGTIGRVGLIKGTVQVEGGAESLSFGKLFEDIQPYLGRAIVLNLLVLLAGIIVGVLTFVVVFGVTFVTFGFGLLCLIPLLCLLIPVGIYISIVIEQANIALVAEDLGVGDALKRGWNFVRDNLASMVVMGLVLVLGGGIVAFIFSIPIVFIVFPAVFGSLLDTGSSAESGLIIAAICFVVYLPVLLLLSGILQSYIKSAWTLTFLRLTSPSIEESAEAIPAAT